MMIKEHISRAVRPGRGDRRHQRLGRRAAAVQRRQQRPGPARRRRCPTRHVRRHRHDGDDGHRLRAAAPATTTRARSTGPTQQKAAVDGHGLLSGHRAQRHLPELDRHVPRPASTRRPAAPCPRELKYDPEDNPTGVRCTLQDANVNVFGRDPATGFARRPLDNVGVQYGLGALRAGVIDFAAVPRPQPRRRRLRHRRPPQAARHAMSSEVAALAYRLGGVIGRGALAETPGARRRARTSTSSRSANIHEAVRPFVVRARLRAHTGQDASQVDLARRPHAGRRLPDDGGVARRVEARPPGPGRRPRRRGRRGQAGRRGDRCAFGTVGGRLELPDADRRPARPGAAARSCPAPACPTSTCRCASTSPRTSTAGVGPCSLAAARDGDAPHASPACR